MDLSSHSPLVGVWGVALTSNEVNSRCAKINASSPCLISSSINFLEYRTLISSSRLCHSRDHNKVLARWCVESACSLCRDNTLSPTWNSSTPLVGWIEPRTLEVDWGEWPYSFHRLAAIPADWCRKVFIIGSGLLNCWGASRASELIDWTHPNSFSMADAKILYKIVSSLTHLCH